MSPAAIGRAASRVTATVKTASTARKIRTDGLLQR